MPRARTALHFCYDPTGERYGLPTYPWRMAPAGLATRRQLLALELRPGGQEPAGQILWRRGKRKAYLYRIDLAKPKRIPTLAQLDAIERALAARRTCKRCGTDAGYCLPKHWDGCPACNPTGTIGTPAEAA